MIKAVFLQGGRAIRTSILTWLVSGAFILFFYNNCGRSFDAAEQVDAFSSLSKSEYPWPNGSTSMSSSGEMVSKVVFGDFDMDSVEDAAFISSTADGEELVLRVVRSTNFTEQFNITGIPVPPDDFTDLLFVDLDQTGGRKELVYLSKDRGRVVGVDLSDQNGRVRFNLPMIEPIDAVGALKFNIQRMARGNAIEIGENLINYGRNKQPSVESGVNQVDGAWGDWGGWFQYGNGTTCSKACGDGLQIRNRICNNPAPRNGGQACGMESANTICDGTDANDECVARTISQLPRTCVYNAETRQNVCSDATSIQELIGGVHMQACRVRDCQEDDCKATEVLVNGNCVDRALAPDEESSDEGSRPEDTEGSLTDGGSDSGSDSGSSSDNGGTDSGSGSSDNGSSGSDNSSSSGSEGPESCAGDEVWEPHFYRCFRAYPHEDIYMSHQQVIHGGDDEPDVTIDHTYRIGLNHEGNGSMSQQSIAGEYCRYQGHLDAVSYTVDTYEAGSDAGSANVFLLCNIAENGRYLTCPLQGQNYVRFDYQGFTYAQGATVQYLKSVICRRDQQGPDELSTGPNLQGKVFSSFDSLACVVLEDESSSP